MRDGDESKALQAINSPKMKPERINKPETQKKKNIYKHS